MPAFEAEIRWQQLGEKVRVLRQMELGFPAGSHYAYEHHSPTHRACLPRAG